MASKVDFSRLKKLLKQQEKFPFDYIVKFIGKNTDSFSQGVTRFEAQHPILKLQSRRESQGGKHIALTYTFSARSAEHIIATLEQVALIDDLLVIL